MLVAEFIKKLDPPAPPAVLQAAENVPGEKYSGEALDSILEQTYWPLEFIVVDHGSTGDPKRPPGSCHTHGGS